MKRILALVVGLLIAAVYSGWREHGAMVSAFNGGCLEEALATEAQCQCGAEIMRDRVSFVQLAGMGSYRPLMSSVDMDQVVDEIGAACFEGTASG